jgi:hypothetical protein
MKMVHVTLFTVMTFALVNVSQPAAADEKKPVEKKVDEKKVDKKEAPANQWTGSVDDQSLMAKAPKNGVIVSQKALDELWKAWKVSEKTPEVDFSKDLVVVGTTVGSRIFGKPMVKDGDLKIAFASTLDLREGFRYIIVTIPREGIKTVNGKDLPKE